MKRLGFAVVGGTLLMFLWAAAPALAGSELPQPPGVPGGEVVGVPPAVPPAVPPGVPQPPVVPGGEVVGPPAGAPPEVLGGEVVRPPGGLAFTGAEAALRLWMVLAASLLIAGVALLIASRRRRATPTK